MKAIRQAKFQAIGTEWDIQVQAALTDNTWAQLVDRIQKRAEAFDALYSRFRPDSLVSRMAREPGSYTMPPDCYKLLSFYHQLYKVTSGKVTPLIGQTMVDAGYDAAYSLQKKALHQPPKWDETLLSYTESTIANKQSVLLDFGAAGKGYLVDIVSELIEAAGIHAYIINAGGDIRYHSPQPWQTLEIGLENPLDTSEAIGIVTVANGSLCASAGSKRKWAGINHIIDPVTLESPEDIIATWVLATDTMTADGLATALSFTAPDVLLKTFSFSYALLRKDMSLQYSKDFPVKIFEAA
ncbi:FAD:protein FMN transferase [soil metagenome]